MNNFKREWYDVVVTANLILLHLGTLLRINHKVNFAEWIKSFWSIASFLPYLNNTRITRLLRYSEIIQDSPNASGCLFWIPTGYCSYRILFLLYIRCTHVFVQDYKLSVLLEEVALMIVLLKVKMQSRMQN